MSLWSINQGTMQLATSLIARGYRKLCRAIIFNICLCSPADYKKSDILKSYSVEEYDQLKKTICHISCPLVEFKAEIKQGKDSLQLPKLFLRKDYRGVGLLDIGLGYSYLRPDSPAVSKSC